MIHEVPGHSAPHSFAVLQIPSHHFFCHHMPSCFQYVSHHGGVFAMISHHFFAEKKLCQAYRELSEADGWRRWRRPRGRFEVMLRLLRLLR